MRTIFVAQETVGGSIDVIIESMSHPFFMVIFGLVFWFALIWSLDMEKRKKKGITFWADQKDEVVVAFIGGLMFLIWDDEIIQGYYDWKGITGEPELKAYFYLIIAPAIDRVYWALRKLRKNGSEST
jgi:hypothetical protein